MRRVMFIAISTTEPGPFQTFRLPSTILLLLCYLLQNSNNSSTSDSRYFYSGQVSQSEESSFEIHQTSHRRHDQHQNNLRRSHDNSCNCNKRPSKSDCCHKYCRDNSNPSSDEDSKSSGKDPMMSLSDIRIMAMPPLSMPPMAMPPMPMSMPMPLPQMMSPPQIMSPPQLMPSPPYMPAFSSPYTGQFQRPNIVLVPDYIGHTNCRPKTATPKANTIASEPTTISSTMNTGKTVLRFAESSNALTASTVARTTTTVATTTSTTEATITSTKTPGPTRNGKQSEIETFISDSEFDYDDKIEDDVLETALKSAINDFSSVKIGKTRANNKLLLPLTLRKSIALSKINRNFGIVPIPDNLALKIMKKMHSMRSKFKDLSRDINHFKKMTV